ncbi:MAG: histidine--tRNA ligase [Phycisphaeraceae bacterium]|nr:histidine--tRNA ligase [Phycisphaeraceae bacterium]
MPSHVFQAPTGTRDFYPADCALRRFITESWRAASIRHGFDEVDGPTFEHLDLYTVKSGEGIVSELFSFTRAGGERTYALRPEFTPTLARLYAAKAGSLPRPTKWFCTPTFFRAERPQRGRLREFMQWNVDVLGDPSPQADVEVIATCVSLFRVLGFTPADLRVRINHRAALCSWFESRGIAPERHEALLSLLDQKSKLPAAEFAARLAAFGFTPEQAEVFVKGLLRTQVSPQSSEVSVLGETMDAASIDPIKRLMSGLEGTSDVLDLTLFSEAVAPLATALAAARILDWVDFDLSIVRGLAYYTGMVFEVHEAGGQERAVAGGGRYDNLVELFGGPPTPAVGMGMGDVVLSLVMKDKGLVPSPANLAEAIGVRPDVFVISNGDPGAEASLMPTVAALRESGLHVRHTYKTTRNVGKLLREASDTFARLAVIIEGADHSVIKDLGTGVQDAAPTPMGLLPAAIEARLRRGGGPGGVEVSVKAPDPG